MRKNRKSASIFTKPAGVFAVIIIGAIGSVLVAASHAATVNHTPTGSFTSVTCTSGGTYVINASWSDSDASSPANAYIGTATSKGNYAGAGSATASDAIDNTSHNGPSYTWTLSTGTIPDSSWPIKLWVHDIGNPTPNTWKTVKTAPKPTCPAPPPPANPPPPSGGSGGSSSGGGTSGSTTKKTTTAPATPTNNADGTVTPGTVGVSIKVPADNASSVRIAYDTKTTALGNSTDAQPVNGDTTVIINNLTAKTTYTYQIVRTNAAGTVVSPAATFTTKGFTISLTFQDSDSNPVPGIVGSINDSNHTKATSDKSGVMTFGDLDAATYTVSFSYQGHQHTLDYDTTDPSSISTGGDQVAVLSDSINVDQFTSSDTSNSRQATVKHSHVGLIIFIILLVLLIPATVFFWLRRRRANHLKAFLSASTGPPPTDTHLPPPAVPAAPTNPHVAAVEPAAHPGESLRDMVIKSMHEQAQQKAHDKQPPQTPPS